MWRLLVSNPSVSSTNLIIFWLACQLTVFLLVLEKSIRSFLSFAITSTLLLASIKYGWGGAYLHDTLWYIIAFVFGLTFLSLVLGLRAARKSPETIVHYALGGTVVRLVLSVIVIYVALRIGVADRLWFVLNFMAVYFVFLAFEIYSLLTTLRANFETPT